MTPTQAEANVNAKLRELAEQKRPISADLLLQYYFKAVSRYVTVRHMDFRPIAHGVYTSRIDVAGHTCPVQIDLNKIIKSDNPAAALRELAFQHIQGLLPVLKLPQPFRLDVDTSTFAEGGFVKGSSVDVNQILP